MKQLAWCPVKKWAMKALTCYPVASHFNTHNLVKHLSFSSGCNGPWKIIPCLTPWPLDFKTSMMGTPLRPWDIDCFHCKKFLSYIKMKPLWVQLVPFACCPLHVCSCEERAFMLFVAAFWELENYDEIPLRPLFSSVKRPNSLSLSPQNRFSSSLTTFVALLWALSKVSMSFLNGASQDWAQYCRCGLTAE